MALASGVPVGSAINLDLEETLAPEGWTAAGAARAMGVVEEARADLADETNLNARLVLERLFLRLAELDRAPAA